MCLLLPVALLALAISMATLLKKHQWKTTAEMVVEFYKFIELHYYSYGFSLLMGLGLQ